MNKQPLIILEAEIRYRGRKKNIRTEIDKQAIDYPASLRILLDEHMDKCKRVITGITNAEKL